MNDPSRILGIDPGEKRVGIAVSDPTRTIASPLTVIQYRSREDASQQIVDIALEQGARRIVVGQAIDWDGKVSRQGQKAARFAAAIEEKTDLPVLLWNEYGSTKKAQNAQIEMGLSREKRQDDVDHIAATVILQSYLDTLRDDPDPSDEQ